MNDISEPTRAIIVEEEFPHAPALLWRAITDGSLMEKWMMPPSGFRAVVGHDFTFQTRAAGAWDGTIRCRVLDVIPNQRLSYSWTGGDAGNIGYGSLLRTVVTLSLEPTSTGTLLRLEHAGFAQPRNDVAYQNMSGGWTTVMGRFASLVDEMEKTND
jgi:uncharacterized protein YndB with AHSA1/START domain